MWLFILRLLASIAEYYSRKQLLDAGKAQERLDVLEAEEAAENKAEAVVKEISTLPSSDVIVRLSKYRRD